MAATGNWTVNRVNVLKKMLKDGKTNGEIASVLGVSRDAITHKISREGLQRKVVEKPLKPETLEDIDARYKKREEILALRGNEKKLIERIRYLEREREAIKSITGQKVIRPIKQSRPGKIHATAFIVCSDWHIDEPVRAESVNYLNEYNLEIADARLTRFFNNAISLVEMKAKDTNLDGVVFALLGDMISGSIHEELMANSLLPPLEAIWWVQKRLAGGLKLLLKKCDELGLPLTVVGKVGNHPRLTKKIHVSSEQGNNLEWYMYLNLEQMIPRINWVLEKNYLTYLDVYGFMIRLHHGWAVNYNGGIGGVMIAINKANAAWDRGTKAHLSVSAHWHTQITAYNSVLNGSGIGLSAYGVSLKVTPEPAQQKFFMITKTGRLTAEYSIFLDGKDE